MRRSLHRHPAAAATVFALVLLTVVGCSVEEDDWSYGALVDVKSFRAEEGERRLEFVVPEGETTALRVGVELTSGGLAITVRDPAGAEAWTQVWEAPEDEVTSARFGGASGDWTVEVDFRDGATGRYDLRIVSE